MLFPPLWGQKEAYPLFCPNCEAEYRAGIDECSDCEVRLVEELPPKSDPHAEGNVDLVTVFASGDSSLIGIATSLFDEAGIQYVTKGEALQDLLGAGRLGVGFNPIAGPIELQVKPEYRQKATDLLVPLCKPASDDNPEREDGGAGEQSIVTSDSLAVSARAKRAFRVLVLAELALPLIGAKLSESFNETLPPAVRAYVNSLSHSERLTSIAYDLYQVSFGIGVVASLGLLMFWRLAPHLYALSWLLWLLWAVLGGGISNGPVAFCASLNVLMGGAIIGLTLLPPINAAFVRHEPQDQSAVYE